MRRRSEWIPTRNTRAFWIGLGCLLVAVFLLVRLGLGKPLAAIHWVALIAALSCVLAWLLPGVPCRIHWLFVIVSGALIPVATRQLPDKAQRGEWYPFSNFPMYSDFEKQAYYVYITDREDKPLSVGETFGRAPSDVKKLYDRKLKELAKTLSKPSKKLTLEERRPVADAILRELRDTSKYGEKVRQHRGFRLYQVDITLEDGRIVQKTTRAGEI